MNPAFIEALDELGSLKGISREAILQALQESLEKGFRKQLGGEDALVKVEINPDTGAIYMAQIKKVVEEVEDDFLEISLAEAKSINKDLKVGDDYLIEMPLDEIKKATAMSIKSILKQKITEIEKINLYEKYKDKIGDMIIGRVDKIEENGISVSLDQTPIYLPKQQLIKDERFKIGEPIKLYVSDVASGPKGARIIVSRSNEGFLKRILEEEIHEIYDGTIVIKGIAREAGERSKIAVYSNDPNVDPAGACIGPNGSRIQKVVAQLGNSPQKERIDVITYNENPGLFIIESLKPAEIVGIKIDEEEKKATAIVQNEKLSVAIGKKGANVRLACQLTGYGVDIKELDTALAENIQYMTPEELEREDISRKQKLAQEAFAAASRKKAEESKEEIVQTVVREAVPEGYVAPNARVYQDEIISEEERESLEKTVDLEEFTEVGAKKEVKEEVAQPVVEQPSVEPVEEPSKEVKEEKVEIAVEVKTTKTLEDLEKELEAEAKRSKQSFTRSRKFKKKEDEKEDESVITTVDPAERMSIYTEEELEEFEKEEAIDEFDSVSSDVDYDEYDTYYDDDDN